VDDTVICFNIGRWWHFDLKAVRQSILIGEPSTEVTELSLPDQLSLTYPGQHDTSESLLAEERSAPSLDSRWEFGKASSIAQDCKTTAQASLPS